MFVSIRARTTASVLHADLDAFFASVEQRDDPALRGRPISVGGGVVMAASYEARAFGVRSGMGGRQARRLCPDLISVPGRWAAYVEASKAVMDLFEQAAPTVEKLSIDEAFLDVSGLEHISGTPARIAARLRREVLEEVGLPLTVGVARTKFLAKVASGVAKPDGLLVVEPGDEIAFLHPLRVERLWGVGPATAARLHSLGIATVGEVAQLSEHALVSLLGRAAGRKIHALAHNRDPRRVEGHRRRSSFGAQSALGRSRPRTAEALDGVLVSLADRVTRRMRASGRRGRTVVLRLRFGDFARATRSRTLPGPTSRTREVLDALRGLLAASMPMIEERGVTLLGVTITGLDRSGRSAQLVLPIDGPDDRALDRAIDDVRDRFGPTAVTRATLLGSDPGLAAWLAPDEEAPPPPGRAGAGAPRAAPRRPADAGPNHIRTHPGTRPSGRAPDPVPHRTARGG